MYFSSGNEIVDKMGTINFAGNVIPEPWYRMITRENGKPYLNAIIILADIVYWYRPEVVRDEATGQMIGIRKRFRDDALQRSYKQLADKFGFSERDAQRAIVHLESLGLIQREFRTISIGKDGLKLNNVLFIHIDVDTIFKITFSAPDEGSGGGSPQKGQDTPCYQEMKDPVAKFGNRGYQELQEGPSKNGNRGFQEMREAPSTECDTNTKTTTETTTENTTEITTESDSLSPSLKRKRANKKKNVVVLDPKDRQNPMIVKAVKAILEKSDGIPYTAKDNIEGMTGIIQAISDWNDYLGLHEGEDWKISVFKLTVECLVEMATADDFNDYNGAHVSYANVIDQINVILRNYKESYNCFGLFVSMVVDRFIEIQQETRVINQKSYLKSLIWTSFSTYVTDWQSYYHRSYYKNQER